MAAALESVPENEVFKENSEWWIEVYETNYQFNKRIPVYGQMTIGEMIFHLVKEFGKSTPIFQIFVNNFSSN